MKSITFVTGNANKAAFLERNLGITLTHRSMDIVEIQSLDVAEVAAAKAKSAYAEVGGPVLVEDVSLVFTALGQLPGPLVKWFLKDLGNERLCRLLDPFNDRSAKHIVNYCLYDGQTARNFYGAVSGEIANQPRDGDGWGFDAIFIPEGTDKTRAELSQEEQDQHSPRRLAVAALKKYLQTAG